MKAWLSAVIVGLICVACAGSVALVSQEPPMCLPPSVTTLPLPSSITSGESVRTDLGPGILLRYRDTTHSIDIVWVEGKPIAIDPDATDPLVPVWLKSSEAPCRWYQEWVGGERV